MKSERLSRVGPLANAGNHLQRAWSCASVQDFSQILLGGKRQKRATRKCRFQNGHSNSDAGSNGSSGQS